VSDLINEFEVVGQVLAIVEIPKDYRALGGDGRITHGIMRAPKLHVGRIGCIANVERIAEKDTGEIATLQLGADALESVAARRRHIRCGEA